MRIDYQQAIGETGEELAAQERKLRGRPVAMRVRMLHLLKSGQVPSLAQCAPLLGYSQTQLTRWWEQYQRQGLAPLLVEQPRGGKTSRLTADARTGLEEAMRRGEIATLRDAQRYLQEEWGISYRRLNGIWWQLRQHQIRLKTGRRQHKQADKEAQQTFKAGFRGDARTARGGAGVGL